MNEKVVVTLKAAGFEKDFELPGRIPLSELYPRLTAALQQTSPRKFGDYTGVILEHDQAGLLDLSATLSDYGICTGSVLEIAMKEKYNGFIAGKRENRWR